MCCLFGLIDYGQNLSGKMKSCIVRELSIASEERGTDATGIAYNSPKGLHVFKRPQDASSLKLRFPRNTRVIMGHTRMTTQGSEKKNCNNHPFLGNTSEGRFALAHNGVLYNDTSVRKIQKLPKTKIETDSYVAVQLIEKKNTLDALSLKFMAEQVKGTFVFTVLDENDNITFVRGDNPLCIYHSPEIGVYVYASTEAILRYALMQCNYKLEKFEKVKVEGGDILTIDREGLQCLNSFNFPSDMLYEYPYAFSMYDPTNSGFEDEYIDELKSVAFSYGYAEEMIDKLLEHGFTSEEIEEFIYEHVYASM